MAEHTLYDRRNRYVHLDTDGTTVLRNDTIHLVRVVIGSDESGTTVTIQESGNTVAVITSDVNATQGTYEYDITLDNLSVIIAGGAGSELSATVVYK